MDIAIYFVILILTAFAVKKYVFRKKIDEPFPDKWRSILEEKVSYYKALSAEEQIRFEASISQFLKDVDITGIETEVSDADRMLVASSAVIPLFGFPGWKYRNLNEVLLYKNTFSQEYETEGSERNVLGMVGEGAMNRMMILSKPALHKGFEDKTSKRNVGIHEFVHLLDKADGSINGIPDLLMEQQYTIPWIKLMHEEIEEIKERDSDINPYGATNEAEFLSVISEYFFKRPELFAKKHPELFDLLEKMYHQDLA